jgi:hypothetical protein
MIESVLLARALFACCVVVAVCGGIASFLLIPGKRRFFKNLYSHPKSDFTALGLRLRQSSLFFTYLAFAIAIIFLVMKNE